MISKEATMLIFALSFFWIINPALADYEGENYFPPQTNMIGVKNIVSLAEFNVANTIPCPQDFPTMSCFSIQQNFLVATANNNEPYKYWAQNIIIVSKDLFGNTKAGSIFQLFDMDGNLVDCEPKLILAYIQLGCKQVGKNITGVVLPNEFILVSEIRENQLVMKNNYGDFQFPIESGSVIKSNYFAKGAAELVLVGTATNIFNPRPVATFAETTHGSVDSFIKIKDNGWSGSINKVTLNDYPKIPWKSTVEDSLNLQWWIVDTNKAEFKYAKGSDNQGIRLNYVPVRDLT